MSAAGPETGSGKTLAFGVPLLARITAGAEARRPRGLVLVPTRELAIQVAEVLAPVAAEPAAPCSPRTAVRPGPADRRAQARASTSSSPRRCASST